METAQRRGKKKPERDILDLCRPTWMYNFIGSSVTLPSAIEVSEKPRNSPYPGSTPHTSVYYAKCMLGGILSCGITHAAMTPLDVTKCNIQAHPHKYKGLFSGLRTILHEEGATAIWKGFTPTLLGYSAQGCFKYGLYEIFKDQYSNFAGPNLAERYRGLIWCLGSASAEFFADIALCPLEMVKIKIQTAPNGSWPLAFGPALMKMRRESGNTRFPFGSLGPLWWRQIPYTVAKFYCFEEIVSRFYTHVLTKPKESYSNIVQLAVSFTSGYAAGIICAVVSQPADNLVSQLSKPSNKERSVYQIARNVGLKDLITKGMGTRILMVGTLTAFQWYIYDSFKTIAGLGTTGGK